MREFRSSLFVLPLVAALIFSCKQPEEQKTYSIKLADPASSSLTFDSAPAEKNVAFTSEQAWSASSDDFWLSVAPSSGNGGSSNIVITVAGNTSDDNRTSSVKIVSGTASQTISVTQTGISVLGLEQSEFSVGYEACAVTVTVISNVDYTVTVDPSSPWISYSDTKSAVKSTFSLAIQQNASYSPRTGKVTVSAGDGLSAVVTVTQAETRSTTFDESQVVLSLGVVSDVHINNGNQDGGEVKKWSSALTQLKSKASILDADGIDGILVNGDLIDQPSTTQLSLFKSTFESVYDPSTMPMIYSIGNHDVPGYAWASTMVDDVKYIRSGLGENYFKTDLEPENGTTMECRHCKIGDYHILCISPNGDSPIVYDNAAVTWLDNTLKNLTEDNPTRYVIVLTHPMIYNTVYGSKLGEDDGIWSSSLPHYWSSSVLTSVLSKYPQAVVFGGHLHFPMNDPRTIWQGDFTVAGTASTRYMAIESGGYQNMASATTMKDRAQFSQGYLLQFDRSGNMRLNRMDFYNGSVIAPNWEIQYPSADKANLHKYNHTELAAANKAPVLSEMNVDDCETTSDVVVTWTSAQDDEFVHHYVLTLKNGSTTVATRKYLTDFYLYPDPSSMKKKWEANFGTFEEGNYTATLTAYDSWDASATMTKEFKVEKAKPAELSMYADVKFDNSTISDALGNLTITNKSAEIGTMTVSHKGKSYSVNGMKASSGKYAICEFKNITTSSEMKSFASASFTVEAFYIDAEPGTSDHGIMSGQSYGGWGLVTSGSSHNNVPCFIVASGSSSYTFNRTYATSANPTDELTHVVAVYDYSNTKVRIYINGKLDTTTTVAIPFFPGTEDTFNRFCLGSDIRPNNKGGDYPCVNTTIVSARIYRGAMTDDGVATVYANAVKALGD